MEELIDKVEETRREHIEYLLSEMIPSMFGFLAFEGFDLADDECIKTTTLFTEAFKAALYKAARMDHPLHDLAVELWDENVEDEDGLEVEFEPE